MVDRPNKPSALATTPGLPPQAQVNITHGNQRVNAVLPTGESLEILLYGATVTSWKDANGVEKLWLSEAAKLDGSKAVRGGIPLVFPVFGTAPTHPQTSSLPQHGFARNNTWEFLGKSTSESGSPSVTLDFGLSPASLPPSTRESWPFNFNLLYSVTLDAKTLSTTLVVTNQGEEAFDCQVLMHTYLRVKDVAAISIEGLKDASFIDKVDGLKTKTEDSAALSLTGETDRVYTPATKAEALISVLENGTKKFTVSRENLDDVVVWNPWTEKAAGMADFEPKDGWKNMLCVEAGSVGGWTKLENGDQFVGAQTITLG